jgi:uncharacterized protein involved in exopolysaccharide biosynthesis
MGEEFTLEDALIVLQRRWAYFLIPAIILAVLGVGIIMALPAKYTAQGTILVESAQIPSELVRSTVNTYAQERIQTIKQRVMTRDRLLGIADRYSLFPEKSGLTESEQVKKIRDRLVLSLITANGARVSGQRDGTIAFTVSYTDGSPDRAFQVANEFMTLFLSEDVRTRTAGASNTTDFFKQEVARLAGTVDQIEAKIAQYKAEHAGALPEHLNLHLNMLEQANRDLTANQAAITSLDEELRFLQTQLSSYFSGANTEKGPATELTRLKAELVQLRSVYHDSHPNVKAVRDQIRALEAELAPSREIQTLQGQLADADKELREAEKALEAGDPAIEELRAKVADLQERLTNRIETEATSGGGDFLSAQLQARIAVANSRRSALEERGNELTTKITELQARIASTPEVERGLQQLTRNYENVSREYQDVLAKQQEAQLAENLEDNQKAEKFSILEPAQRPEEPSSPERVKLAILALFAALGAGGLTALGAEFLFQTVRGRHHFEKILETQAIAVIPYFERGSAPGLNFFKISKKTAGARGAT